MKQHAAEVNRSRPVRLAVVLAAAIVVGYPTLSSLAQSRSGDGDVRAARERPKTNAGNKDTQREPRKRGRNFDGTIDRIPQEGGICEIAPPCPSWCQLDFRSNTCFEPLQSKPQ